VSALARELERDRQPARVNVEQRAQRSPAHVLHRDVEQTVGLAGVDTLAMRSWLSCEPDRASRRKRPRRASLPTSSGRNVSSATGRPSTTSVARCTCPMPP
jgi:hypothetical protein